MTAKAKYRFAILAYLVPILCMIVCIAPLSASVIIGDSSVCTGDIKSYFTPLDISREWEVIGGEIIGSNIEKNVTIEWERVGYGFVKLKYLNEYTGIFDSSLTTVSVIARPSPFICGNPSSCIYTEETYTYKSPNKILDIEWQIYNGDLLSDSNSDTIRVLWHSSGLGYVKIIASNENACTDTSELVIAINNSIEPVILGNTFACIDQYEEYRPECQQNMLYKWSITNGRIVGSSYTKEITVVWDSLGTGSLTLEQTNNYTQCSRTTTKQITINSVPAAELNDFPDICYSGEDYELYGGKPLGGYYSGKWVVDNRLKVGIAGSGEHQIIYNKVNQGKCVGSDTAYISVRSTAATPQIIFQDNMLHSDSQGETQWYLDDVLITNATLNSLKPNNTGYYSATSNNDYGCKSPKSNKIYIDISSVNTIYDTGAIAVIQNEDCFLVKSAIPIYAYSLFDLGGAEISKQSVFAPEIIIENSALPSQIYILLLYTADGKVESIKIQN